MLYTLVFVTVGILLVVSGYQQGGLALIILAALGFSGIVNGFGHLWAGARVFGKRADGVIPWWSKLVHLPFLSCTWLIWYLICRLSREPAWNWITDSLAVGRRVYPHEVDTEFANWVDLTAEFDEPRRLRERQGYLALPVLDGGIPSPDALQETLGRMKDGPTYVHCAQGHGRAALFAVILLLAQDAVSDLESGLELLKQARPGIHLNRRQKRFVGKFIQQWRNRAAAPA